MTRHDDTQDLEAAAALRRMVGALYRRFRVNEEGGLTAAQLSLLASLEAYGPIRPGELAAKEQVTAATMTRSIVWVVERGLARRVSDPDDRRSVRIQLTAEGAGLLATLRAVRTAEFTRRVGALSDEERCTLVRALPALEALWDLSTVRSDVDFARPAERPVAG